jgi:hypothetical protein
LKKPHALIGLLAAVGTAIGVIVAIVGLPYGRLNYTAFAGLYHNGTAFPSMQMEVDCDTGTIGVQSVCNIPVTSSAPIPIDVYISNFSGAPEQIDGFNYDLYNNECNTGCVNGNSTNPAGGIGPSVPVPDATNVSPSNFNCVSPAPSADTGTSAPGAGASTSFLSCSLLVNSTAVANGASVRISGESFSDNVTAVTTITLTLSRVASSDDNGITTISCDPAAPPPANPTGNVVGPCFPAVLNFVPPPPTATPTNTPLATSTNTPTNTAVPTNTPPPTNTPLPGTSTPPSTPPEQHKTCLTTNGRLNTWNTEAGPVSTPGNDGNSNAAGNECNLFICVTPNATTTCSGPGEGHLVVIEQVSNVHTTDYPDPTTGAYDPPDGDGLGAYEFNVEFDSFVLQSVNPSDIIFTSGCPNPADISVATGCYKDGGAGTFPAQGRGLPVCQFSIAFENSVRFACVTHGSADGPNGAFDLAKLDLVPAADDLKDLFPGNNNGIPTLIKDNQCELADIFGHPVLANPNTIGTAIPTSALTPAPSTPIAFPTATGGSQLGTCGDLLVTVRILEGDLNLDCVVDVEDEALIAAHFGAFFGSAFYNKWFDLEPSFHDLDIDIKDVQKVFGRDGSTCQNPIPAQTPVPPPFPLGS